MREAIGIGETVEIATQKAYEALGVESAEIEVLELPEKKFLGLFGGKPAKVRAYVEDTPDAAAVAYLKSILAGMGAEKIEVTSEVTEDGATLNITGEDSGIVIGHHGETLDALQYLVGMAANHACENTIASPSTSVITAKSVKAPFALWRKESQRKRSPTVAAIPLSR